MPQYCYTNHDTGETVIRSFSIMAKTPDYVYEDGHKFMRDIRAEHTEIKYVPGNWPMASDAAGVAAHQTKEAYDHSEKIGIPTQFTSDGRAIFTSRKHRKEYCRAIGLHDRNGGYGDP